MLRQKRVPAAGETPWPAGRHRGAQQDASPLCLPFIMCHRHLVTGTLSQACGAPALMKQHHTKLRTTARPGLPNVGVEAATSTTLNQPARRTSPTTNPPETRQRSQPLLSMHPKCTLSVMSAPYTRLTSWRGRAEAPPCPNSHPVACAPSPTAPLKRRAPTESTRQDHSKPATTKPRRTTAHAQLLGCSASLPRHSRVVSVGCS